MVIGPSLDGGYYLLGLTRVEPRLFQGMRWSTDSVLADTLERATSSGLRVTPLSWLPRLRDVDTLQDLAEWVASCGKSRPVHEAPQANLNTGLNFSQGPSKDCRCESHESQPFSVRQLQDQGTLGGGLSPPASETKNAAIAPHLKVAGAPDGKDVNMKQRRLFEISQRVLKLAAAREAAGGN
ncbi:hypothetical protein Vretimale_17094 [Volvox reticuliferus]|nr:hypothetical protein Vretifemale_18664 [Volvox reticuliferus]GIM14067.1 hypothetical protein Vretimale_17094 [Volvox reticuliferus]